MNTRYSFKPPNAVIFREVAAEVGVPGAASFPDIWLFRVETLCLGRESMAFSFSSHVAGGHSFRSSNHQQLSGLCGNT